MQDNTAQNRTGKVWVYSRAGILYKKKKLKKPAGGEGEGEREEASGAAKAVCVFCAEGSRGRASG